jgi:hypothetical protein
VSEGCLGASPWSGVGFRVAEPTRQGGWVGGGPPRLPCGLLVSVVGGSGLECCAAAGRGWPDWLAGASLRAVCLRALEADGVTLGQLSQLDRGSYDEPASGARHFTFGPLPYRGGSQIPK